MAEEQSDDLPAARVAGRPRPCWRHPPGDDEPARAETTIPQQRRTVGRASTAATGTSPTIPPISPDRNRRTILQPSPVTRSNRSIRPCPPKGDTVEIDLPTDESTDSEADEASDNEIHDLALAVETSGLSPQGHEVTSRPSDDDQGETVRIVTEAVEHGGPGREMARSGRLAGRRGRRARSAEPAEFLEPEHWIVNLMKASRKPATCRSQSAENPAQKGLPP